MSATITPVHERKISLLSIGAEVTPDIGSILARTPLSGVFYVRSLIFSKNQLLRRIRQLVRHEACTNSARSRMASCGGWYH